MFAQQKKIRKKCNEIIRNGCIVPFTVPYSNSYSSEKKKKIEWIERKCALLAIMYNLILTIRAIVWRTIIWFLMIFMIFIWKSNSCFESWRWIQIRIITCVCAPFRSCTRASNPKLNSIWFSSPYWFTSVLVPFLIQKLDKDHDVIETNRTNNSRYTFSRCWHKAQMCETVTWLLDLFRNRPCQI